MAKFKEAEDRVYKNMYICRECNARNRGSEGQIPGKCRKCGGKNFRLKRKAKKA